MIFSEKKIREIAGLSNNISIEDITHAINSIGFEVESVELFNKNKNLKFGHVLSVEKNPNSDKLSVCKIEFNDKIRTIQTAATNVKENDYLIAFVPGSEYDGELIKEKELAGIISEGMLVSLNELGFKNELLRKKWQDEILIIDKIDLSLDPIEYFDLNDNLIDVSILTNRSDAQSYIILAKELSAYFHTNFNFNFIENNKLFKSDFKMESNNDEIKLNGFIVQDIQNFQLNLKEIMLILKSNIASVDNFEDFSSLVMLYTGVYPRIFDLDKIKTNYLTVENKNNNYYLINSKTDISILGISVLNEFKPSSTSKNLLIEFSQIDSKIIRNNWRNNKEFVKSGINVLKKISDGIMLLVYSFIKQYFTITSELINSIKNENKIIFFDEAYLIKYAGFDITKNSNYKRAIKSLNLLDFKFENTSIIVPNYRYDIEHMQDIVEEVFRFYGLNNFESQQPKIFKINSKYSNLNLEKTIVGLGYKQVWTYTLMNYEKNNFNPLNFKNVFKLKTFVSEEYNSIRNSMALPIFDIYQYNMKRKIDKLSFFDIGMINDRNALLISSNIKTYTEIKSDLEKITNQKFVIKPLENKHLHPNYNAGLFLGGKLVGWIGKFNPFWIDSDVIFAEIFLDIIYKPHNQFVEYNNKPLKERDITFTLKQEETPIFKLEKIQSIEGVYSIELVSVYNKDQFINWSYNVKMSEEALVSFDKILDEV